MASKVPPKVIWAQSQSQVFVTVCLEDCKDPTVNVEDSKLFFSGIGGSDASVVHEVSMDLFSEVIPEETHKFPTDRVIEITLTKKEQGGSFWPRLLRDKRRMHWLGVDFKKWKDESDDEVDDNGLMTPLNPETFMPTHLKSGFDSVSLEDLDYISDPDDEEEDIPGLTASKE